MTKLTEIEKELLMLRSGVIGSEIDLQWMAEEGLLSKEGAEKYIKELGGSVSAVAASGKLTTAIQKYHAGI